jgi:leader peptidase (prepilin peptidase)/N-methyltransferase
MAWWVVWSLFLFAFGASVGSFVNVVAWRLPRGASIVSPRSRCPICGACLSWRENLPVVGWLLLRGRCRRCREPISVQYLLIELLVGSLFAGLFLLLYLPGPRSWWVLGTEGWWSFRQFRESWPGFLVLLSLLGTLVPITLIDARTYLIPIGLTLWISITAAVGWAAQSLLPLSWPATLASAATPLPAIGMGPGAAAIGGGLGAILLSLLLAKGWWRRSFHDYEQFVPPGETLGDYPHARREALREAWHLLPIVLGIGGGFAVGSLLSDRGVGLHPLAEALMAVAMGYLVGGGLIWATRILGTLAFGREAMGLGDVHLLAAVGAALGWQDAVAVYLLAPFLGIAFAAGVAVLGSAAFGRLLGDRFRAARGRLREIPYGPHLALAAAAVIFARPAVWSVREVVIPPAEPLAAAAPSGGGTGSQTALHPGGERVQCRFEVPAGVAGTG